MAKKSNGGGNGRRGGEPPKEHQFKPGQSGNPGGRPKKQPSLRETAFKVMNELGGSLAAKPDMTHGEKFVRQYIALSARSAADAHRLLRWLEGDEPAPTTLEAQDGAASDVDEEIIQAALDRLVRRRTQTNKPPVRRPKRNADD